MILLKLIFLFSTLVVGSLAAAGMDKGEWELGYGYTNYCFSVLLKPQVGGKANPSTAATYSTYCIRYEQPAGLCFSNHQHWSLTHYKLNPRANHKIECFFYRLPGCICPYNVADPDGFMVSTSSEGPSGARESQPFLPGGWDCRWKGRKHPVSSCRRINCCL